MRIVWLAAADARGHLMRAHLVRGLLAPLGARVEIVTTSEEGVAFLAALGSPSELLSCHYGVAFDARQNMARAETEACILRYLLSPNRGARDLARLAERARGAAYVVNDFHPLLLLAGSRDGALPCPVVHVYGEHLWGAIEGHLHDRAPAFVDRAYTTLVRRLRDQAYARVEHSLAAPLAGARDPQRRSYRLPPIVAAPRRSAAAARAALGLRRGERLAAVYLNPHFADPALAASLEAALRAEGYAFHAVGEGLAGRPGWRPYDPAFADIAAAADLLVSAPGMGAAGMARSFGVPLLALLTDQPEQRANARALAACADAAIASVDLGAPEPLAPRLREAARALAGRAAPACARPAAAAVAASIHRRWTETLIELAVPATPPAPALKLRPRAAPPLFVNTL